MTGLSPGPVACVVDGSEGWWAGADGEIPAIWRLIVGVRTAARPRADRLLRRRIGCDGAPDRWTRDVVKVVAKRAVQVPVGPPREARAWTDVGPIADRVLAAHDRDEVDLASIGRLDEVAALALADEVGARASREGPVWGWERPVGAVLVGPEGRTLAVQRNRGGGRQGLHAEALLAWRWLAAGRRAPPGSWLAVSWTPCRMCQAWLDRLGVSRVAYGREDRGRAARVGVLWDRGAMARWSPGLEPG